MAQQPRGGAESGRILPGEEEAPVDPPQALVADERDHSLFQREGTAFGGDPEAILRRVGQGEPGEELRAELAHLLLVEGSDLEPGERLELRRQAAAGAPDQQQTKTLSELPHRQQLDQALQFLGRALLEIVDDHPEGLRDTRRKQRQHRLKPLARRLALAVGRGRGQRPQPIEELRVAQLGDRRVGRAGAGLLGQLAEDLLGQTAAGAVGRAATEPQAGGLRLAQQPMHEVALAAAHRPVDPPGTVGQELAAGGLQVGAGHRPNRAVEQSGIAPGGKLGLLGSDAIDRRRLLPRSGVETQLVNLVGLLEHASYPAGEMDRSGLELGQPAGCPLDHEVNPRSGEAVSQDEFAGQHEHPQTRVLAGGCLQQLAAKMQPGVEDRRIPRLRGDRQGAGRESVEAWSAAGESIELCLGQAFSIAAGAIPIAHDRGRQPVVQRLAGGRIGWLRRALHAALSESAKRRCRAADGWYLI